MMVTNVVTNEVTRLKLIAWVTDFWVRFVSTSPSEVWARRENKGITIDNRSGKVKSFQDWPSRLS